jgi:hypothetical protein
MNNYYTYAYLREDGTPYYIGKGKENRAYKDDSRSCARPPRHRILFLKQNLSEEDAYIHEVYMIKHYGRKIDGGILHNVNEGGEITPNHKSKKWWSNGIENKISFECPGDGWYRGRVGNNFKNPPSKQNMKRWNNGIKNKMSFECPGDGWIAGMVQKEIYELYSPDGHVYRPKNIYNFCKERNMDGYHMIKVCRGLKKSHCQWTGKVI